MSRRRKRAKERAVAAPKVVEAIQPAKTAGEGAVTTVAEARLEHRAIANGWLKGMDAEKLGEVAERNIKAATDPNTDLRIMARCTSNVIAMVGQVMEQEKREQGVQAEGKVSNTQINVLIGSLSNEQLAALDSVFAGSAAAGGAAGNSTRALPA